MKKSEVAAVLAEHQRAKFVFDTWGYGPLYECECGLRFHKNAAAHHAQVLVDAGLVDDE